MRSDGEKLDWRWEMDSSDYTILAGGILSTALAMVVANIFLVKGFSLVSWMVWFIVPIGTVLLGLLSAAGFFAAAHLKQKKISLMAAILMTGILVPAYFGHYYSIFSKVTFVEEGTEQRIRASEVMSFWHFYREDLTSRTYVDAVRGGSGKEKPVGNWGYLFGFVEIMGFLVGGATMFFLLAKSKYCNGCQKYFSSALIGQTFREDTAQHTKTFLEAGNEVMIRAELPGWCEKITAKERFSNRRIFYMNLNVCKRCFKDSILEIEYQNPGQTDRHDLVKGSVSEALSRTMMGQDN